MNEHRNWERLDAFLGTVKQKGRRRQSKVQQQCRHRPAGIDGKAQVAVPHETEAPQHARQARDAQRFVHVGRILLRDMSFCCKEWTGRPA